MSWNEIDIDKQTLLFHINTMITNIAVYREINVTNFDRIIAYLAFVCLQNYGEESIRNENLHIF
jgi:hypothetical protein